MVLLLCGESSTVPESRCLIIYNLFVNKNYQKHHTLLQSVRMNKIKEVSMNSKYSQNLPFDISDTEQIHCIFMDADFFAIL